MKSFLLFFLIWMTVSVVAVLPGQQVTHRIIVANGGAYSNPDDFVTLTAYDPVSGSAENLTAIFTQSVQGLLVHDGIAFVAAQDSLARVNIDSGEVEAVVALPGVNKFAVFENMLIISRQFPVSSEFVQVRDIVDLTLIKSFPEVSDEAWEIIVVGDRAYVSIAGGWASTEGKMAIIDLANLAFVEEINFGSEAAGIGPVFQENDFLIFVCKTPWGGSSGSIIKYEIISGNYEVHQIPAAIGKAAGIHNGLIYLVMNGNIGTINLGTMSVEDALFIQNPFSTLDITALCIDSINQHIYVNYSYWIAPDGQGMIYDFDGAQVGSYPVGISAEDVAVDYRNPTNLQKHPSTLVKIEIYPNPCTDYLVISDIPASAKILVYDFNAKKMFEFFHHDKSTAKVDVSGLKSGIYLLAVEHASDINGLQRAGRSATFVKR